uniref:DNA methyltransferase 2 n=1 Tax=Ciona savignyi TaxID=51511 RepID=H2Y5J5_CIOSA
MENPLKVLELYSGIGGMHYALLDGGYANAEVVCSIDISPAASLVYKHNFPCTTHCERSIEGFSAEDFDRMGFNTIMMSPPCQPFTRLGLQKDVDDPRSRSFLHLMKLLPAMQSPPNYILMENVKGFENSKAHELFCKVLKQLGFSVVEFLLSPKQFGIPNSRLRYYLLAKHNQKEFPDEVNQLGKVFDDIPLCLKRFFLIYPIESIVPNQTQLGRKWKEDQTKHLASYFVLLVLVGIIYRSKFESSKENPTKTLEQFLEEPSSISDEYGLPEKTLLRYLNVMDIVNPVSKSSTCFTKSYGYYAEGTGSVLNTGSTLDMSNVLANKLRYFTPTEVANLMCFPEQFSFPDGFTRKQKYKLLGNSLNVYVVSCLLKFL